MARTLAFTYGSLTIGNGQADSSYNLTGRYRFTQDYERAALQFEVVVSNATHATFLAAEAALLAAYRLPDQTLTVALSASNRHVFNPTANSGFNIRANARKIGGEEDTAHSAKYECSVTVELPANLTGRAGRRSSSVNVSTSPAGRRSLVVSGVYTALANNAARAQFAAQVDAYCSTVLTGLGGTWEMVGTPTAESDDQDKTIRFTRHYSEIIFGQAIGTTDHAALVDPKLVLRRTRTSADSSQSLGSAQALVEISADYSVSVKIDQTTDLDALWSETIRPYVLQEAERYAGGTVVVTRETPGFNPSENTFSVAMTIMADAGSKFFQARTEVSDSIDYGIILKPVWDGNPFSRDRYDGPGSWVRTLSRTTLTRGVDTISGNEVVSDHGEPPQFEGFVEVREARRARSWNLGLPGEDIPLRASTTSYTYVRADVRTTTTSSDPTRTRTRS
jgi:hypothetical protein